MRALVRAFGHPERSLKSVLIAGTNGKGSVSAYLDHALRAASLKVGRYTSPHLIDLRERITISGRYIGNTEFERLVLEVHDQSERLIRQGVIAQHPNHFEILTMVAFLHFQAHDVDIAILEVGLGGRLDATNVASPLVCSIVSLDFDHEEFLGHTLSAIATEKAGVARKGRDLILGPMTPAADRTIRAVARRVGAPVTPAFRGVSLRESREGLTIKTPLASYEGLLPLPGAHQRHNLVVAIRILEALSAAVGIVSNPAVSVQGMNSAFWPGRLERIEGRPTFLLDGAHNPAGARALSAFLSKPKTPHVLLFGAMRDKKVSEMAEALFKEARVVIVTRVRMTRAAATAQLARIGHELGISVAQEPTIRLAIQRARACARPGETVVVAGSLYLVGAVRRRLLRKGAAKART